MAQFEHAKLRQMVENATDLTSEARELAERDADYYHGHQWTADEINTLKRRKQPVITSNRIRRKIDAMVGFEQRGRTDPRAYPRSPEHEEAAEVATKALMFVDDTTRFDAKRSAAFEDMLVYGSAGVEVAVEQKRGRFEIVINRLRWEEIFYDPHSREKDFSDAAYIGRMRWMHLDTAMEIYAGTKPDEELTALLDVNVTTPTDGVTFEDRPESATPFRWADKGQRRVRIAEMYYRNKGEWYFAVFSGAGEIYNEVSPYRDEDGKTACGFVLMTAYIDRENNRYGLVRDMISPQDEINKRRSKLLHQLNSRQTIGVRGAVESVVDMKRELAAPDGHVEVNPEVLYDAAQAGIRAFEIVPQSDQVAGQFNLLAESKAEIDLLGPNPALLGENGKSQSGRSIMAQQNAALSELAPVYDSLRDWTLRVYRAMWARIRQYWTEERWIRVTDDAAGLQFVAINQGGGIALDQFGQMVMVPPQNAVAQMDVDIIIDDAPDMVTLQQEQFEQLANLASQGMPIPPEMLIEASSLPNKRDLLQKLREQMQAQAQQAQQMAAQQAQAEAMKAEGSARKDFAGAAKDEAAAVKTQVEAMQMAAGLR